MYPAYKLNKQGNNIHLWCTHFPISNQCFVSCPERWLHEAAVVTAQCWVTLSRFIIGQLSHLLFGGRTEVERWWSRRTCAHLFLQELQIYNSLLNNHQQGNVGLYQKKISYLQGQRRSPRKMVGGAKLHWESNSIPTRDNWRAQTKLCAHQETPHRLSQTCLWVLDCLLWRYGSVIACHRDRDPGCSRPGYGISPLGGGHH